MKAAKIALKVASYGIVAIGGYLLGRCTGCAVDVDNVELPEVNDIVKAD